MVTYAGIKNQKDKKKILLILRSVNIISTACFAISNELYVS